MGKVMKITLKNPIICKASDIPQSYLEKGTGICGTSSRFHMSFRFAFNMNAPDKNFHQFGYALLAQLRELQIVKDVDWNNVVAKVYGVICYADKTVTISTEIVDLGKPDQIESTILKNDDIVLPFHKSVVIGMDSLGRIEIYQREPSAKTALRMSTPIYTCLNELHIPDDVNNASGIIYDISKNWVCLLDLKESSYDDSQIANILSAFALNLLRKQMEVLGLQTNTTYSCSTTLTSDKDTIEANVVLYPNDRKCLPIIDREFSFARGHIYGIYMNLKDQGLYCVDKTRLYEKISSIMSDIISEVNSESEVNLDSATDVADTSNGNGDAPDSIMNHIHRIVDMAKRDPEINYNFQIKKTAQDHVSIDLNIDAVPSKLD